MLKNAMFINVFILFIMSIIFLVKAFSKKADLKKLRQIIVIYMIYIFFSVVFCYSGIVALDILISDFRNIIYYQYHRNLLH